jgi:hypothetical protein
MTCEVPPTNAIRRTPVLLVPAVLALAVLAGGCGDEGDWKAVYPVRGKLLVDGKPAAGAIVSLLPEADVSNSRALRSTGEVQSDGTFRLTTYLAYDGAPAGPHAVMAYWPGPLPPNSSPTDVGPDRLRGRYTTPDHPLARVTITEGENELEPFEIKAK